MLTKSELIFYYDRLTVRGLCLSLLAEFQKAISSEYSVLGLVRPSAIDPENARLLTQSHQQYLGKFTEYISEQLTRSAHNHNEGEEVLGRDGREPAPNISKSRPRLAVDNLNNARTAAGKNNSASEVPAGVVTYDMLLEIPGLSIARLLEIGTAEGVNLKRFKKGRMVKSDYMDAFVAHREEVAQRANTGIEDVEECDISEDDDCADVSGGGIKRRRTTSANDDGEDV